MDPITTEVVVIGAGPGGYAAAFYAADLGKKVVLVEREKRLGGVCLNSGCIPSKALLQATHALAAVEESAPRGIHFAKPTVELDKLRAWKESILTKLSGGVAQLAKMRNVQVVTGRGCFEDSNTLRVETSEGSQIVKFDKAIIAVGSKPAMPKAFDIGSPRVMTSTGALEIADIPARLLVIGGGYIGMELGTVYARLGSEVVVAEALPTVLAGADPDLARPVVTAAKKAFKQIRTNAKVLSLTTAGEQIKVSMEFEGQQLEELYDRVLVSVGRSAAGEDLGLENTKVARDEKGSVKVDARQQTADPAIFAIGDIVGGIMLAHKAHKEARIAVENICGQTATFENITIPAVVFTDPELAWVGLTETEAKARGIQVEVAKFSWAASGRAQSFDRPDGLTKLIIEPGTERILGVGIVGHNAGELIAEATVLIKMGATAKDLALTVHPHPTLSETLMEAAESFYGHATHAMARRRLTH